MAKNPKTPENDATPGPGCSRRSVTRGFVVGLANQRHYMSAYICCMVDGKHLAEAYAKDLGNVSCGKSCIRFRKLEDLNLPVFRKVVKLAAELHRREQ